MTNSAEAAAPLHGDFMIVPLADIERDPDQVRRSRTKDSDAALRELEASIKAVGLLQPLVVRRDERNPQRLTVVAGGRRLTACARLKLDSVPVIVRGEQGARARVLQLIENIQRQALESMDLGRVYEEMMDLEGLTVPVLAARIHKSPQYVRDVLRVYHDKVLNEAVQSKRISKNLAVDIDKQADEVKDALRRRLVRGDTITPATLEAIKRELAEAGIINPRRTRPPATGDASSEAPGTVPSPPFDPRQTRQGSGPVYRLAEAEPDPPRQQPEIARRRPDPFDGVMKPGAANVEPRYGDPEHVIVERPPSRYGIAKPQLPDAPSPPMARESAANPAQPGQASVPADETASANLGTPDLNRAEGNPTSGSQIEEFLPLLNWEAFKGALFVGIERGWSCAALYSHAVALRQ